MEKKIKTSLALILLLALSAIIVALPASGQNIKIGRIKSYPFIGATPNPVGVNQEVLLHIGITEPLQSVKQGWENLTVTIKRPDGQTEILGPIRTDATGGTGRVYVPTMVGIYELQTHFPGQWFNFTAGFGPAATQYNLYFEEGVSDVLLLEVQEEPIPIYPGVPLPEEYWGRPIDAQAQEWSRIAGNWLNIGQFSDRLAGWLVEDNTDAPESPHILWTKPLVIGGLAGGVGPHAYHIGDAYEGFFSGAVIISGKLYYNKFNSIGGSAVDNYVVAVDLHTGETLWEKPLITPDGQRVNLDFGQVFYFDSFNVHGVFSYLIAQEGGFSFFGPPAPETWYFFDPNDGRWLFTMEGIPSGNTVVGPNGELVRYTVNLQQGWMTMWDSSCVIDAYWGTIEDSPLFGSWRPQGKVINATGIVPVTSKTPLGRNGYRWNVTIPKGLPGSVDYVVYNDYIIGYYRDTITFGGSAFNNPPFTIWSISVKPGEEGTLKFNKTYNAPPGNITIGYRRYGTGNDRVFIIYNKEEQTVYGYDLDTGEYLWGPTEPETYLGYLETWSIIYDGKLYTHGTKGIVDCYDIETGEKLWSYESVDPLNEILWSNNWNIRVDFIVDGKIYLRHSEHSPIDPMPRDAPYTCLNATTGEVIWRADGLFRGTDWGGHAMIADSIIATMDTYDMRIYAIGKGPTRTTVTAPDTAITWGSSVLLKGHVTDMSPGTKDTIISSRFPDGVPAVADDYMAAWMRYVYKQFPKPDDVQGVRVHLTAIDPNGNFQDIGYATTDSEGSFGILWTPPVPGIYHVTATFEGSKSYWPSDATTYFVVEEAPAVAQPIEPEVPAQPEAPTAPEQPEQPTEPEAPEQPEVPAAPEQPAEAPFITTEMAIIIAIAVACVVGAATFWVLRKRK